MAWTEVCKVNFGSAIMGLVNFKNMPVKGAIKQLSEESGIPANTLWRWHGENVRELKAQLADHNPPDDSEATIKIDCEKSNIEEKPTPTRRGGKRAGSGRPKKARPPIVNCEEVGPTSQRSPAKQQGAAKKTLFESSKDPGWWTDWAKNKSKRWTRVARIIASTKKQIDSLWEETWAMSDQEIDSKIVCALHRRTSLISENFESLSNELKLRADKLKT